MLDDVSAKAIGFGLLSAATLPAGALLARFWTPGDRVVAALMAFGAGALLSALSIDLIGKSVEHGHFAPLALGCVLGGLFFVALNKLINSRGGFLRKAATTMSHLKDKRERELRLVLRRLGQLSLFASLPPDQMRSLVRSMSSARFAAGETLFRKGDEADFVYVVETGELELFVDDPARPTAVLGPDSVVGEMALLTDERRAGTVVARTDVTAWRLGRSDFAAHLRESPRMASAVRALAGERLVDLHRRNALVSLRTRLWAARASRHLEREIAAPTAAEVKAASVSHSGAPLAIFLGILLDGIPESLVIGSSMIEIGISLSLIAGLFLSNFPEALSSSVGMRQNGMGFGRIMAMWIFLMLLTGAGAWLGRIFFVGAPPFVFALTEGLAAGAMLTMIAETMLPEAFHKGGSVTGLATLAGFLIAVMFKTIE